MRMYISHGMSAGSKYATAARAVRIFGSDMKMSAARSQHRNERVAARCVRKAKVGMRTGKMCTQVIGETRSMVRSTV
jgi:hypothetical protein